MSECKFCKLAEASDATRVGSVYYIEDGYPVTPGHTLIIPVKHRADYFELSSTELNDTNTAIWQIRKNLLNKGAQGFNIGWNCGTVAGQTIGHAHCHVIPRHSGDMSDPTGGVRGVIPAKQKY